MLGVAGSLARYRASAAHHRGLVSLYAEFVGRGDLVVDVGAHVGDRVRAFRALGARVLALEPNPMLARLLRLLHGRDRAVTVIEAAAGCNEGRALLRVNRANPSVSTLSDGFVAATDGAVGWEGQRWEGEADVAVTTLAALEREHGRPAFVKIDAEGFEPEILAGLGNPPPVLSFEITTAARETGRLALARAADHGYRRFRFSFGESHRFDAEWMDAPAMDAYLAALPVSANSGDVYAARD
jgi:FkbM family methyltransferase